MECDTLYGNFVVKLIWRLSVERNNLIYHVFFMKTPTLCSLILSWYLHKNVTLYTVSIKSLYLPVISNVPTSN